MKFSLVNTLFEWNWTNLSYYIKFMMIIFHLHILKIESRGLLSQDMYDNMSDVILRTIALNLHVFLELSLI